MSLIVVAEDEFIVADMLADFFRMLVTKWPWRHTVWQRSSWFRRKNQTC